MTIAFLRASRGRWMGLALRGEDRADDEDVARRDAVLCPVSLNLLVEVQCRVWAHNEEPTTGLDGLLQAGETLS
jgi:hypothetical protein